VASEKPILFARRATGIVRLWNFHNVYQFGLLSMGIVVEGGVIWLMGPTVFPGSNITYSLLIAVFYGCVAAGLIYAMMVSVFPRAGADYVWQGRLIHPSIAFANFFVAQIITGPFWLGVNLWWLRSFFWQPMLTWLSYVSNNPGYLALAAAAADPTFMWFFTLVLDTIVLLPLLPGVKLFLKAQWGIAVLYLSACAVILLVFATGTHAGFVQGFNAFMAHFAPQAGQANYYQGIIDQAAKAGANLTPEFSWYATLGILPLIWYTIGWPPWISVQLGGEAKGAKSFRHMFWAIAGIMGTMGLMLLGVNLGLTYVVGDKFANAVSYLWTNSGTAAVWSLPTDPYFPMFLSVLNSNPAIVFWIMFIPTLALVFGNSTNQCVMYMRQVFAVGFDRLFPTSFTRLDKRWNSPVNAWILFWIQTMICVTLAAFTDIMTYFLAMGLVAQVGMLLTAICGMILPYRMKETYRVSPVSKYKVAGIPAIVFVGLAAAGFFGILLFYILTVPALGIAYEQPMMILAGFYVFSIALYFIIRVFQKRRGIDLDLLFKEVPPE
jgi:APA family basic amino acid/polyamine antiporter